MNLTWRSSIDSITPAFFSRARFSQLEIAVVEGKSICRRVASYAVEEFVVPGGSPASRGIPKGRDGKAREPQALIVDGELQTSTLHTSSLPNKNSAVTEFCRAVWEAVEVLFVCFCGGDRALQKD